MKTMRHPGRGSLGCLHDFDADLEQHPAFFRRALPRIRWMLKEQRTSGAMLPPRGPTGRDTEQSEDDEATVKLSAHREGSQHVTFVHVASLWSIPEDSREILEVT